MSNISFDIIDPTPSISFDILCEDTQIPVNTVDTPVSFSVEVISSQPLSIDLISGGIKGDKGDKGDPGDVEDYDPGDLTLLFDNKLI